MTMANLLMILAIVGTSLAPILGFINNRSIRNVDKKVEETHEKVSNVEQQVVTTNGMTLIQIVEAIESRRIASIPAEDRTSKEQQHLVDVPIPINDSFSNSGGFK